MSKKSASFNSRKTIVNELTFDDVSSRYLGWLNNLDVNRHLELGEEIA